MRLIIIGLSIVFFTLSGIITFKALELPVHKASYQDKPKDVRSEANNVIKKMTEDQDANRAVVADLQATIAQLEDKLKTKEQVIESIKITDAEKDAESRPRILAVFGGETFSSGRVAINDNDVALSMIENIVGEISASQGSRVIIEGHTDNIPTGKRHLDNMGLSLQRARAIANVLVSHGVSSDRISVIGYGEAQPIGSNDTEEGRAKNRRVEVKLIPKEGKN
ncbi:MAG: OmpA family protein [Methylobacter sp.]|uniref:OmpA family protein n=1 Tax=Candidatus Methylobacter titanis TaxID=3053457 RepID=A0AA43Q3D5_9GAMM|nr:OmpA family protein [Candidatus Methylobacter titanis]